LRGIQGYENNSQYFHDFPCIPAVFAILGWYVIFGVFGDGTPWLNVRPRGSEAIEQVIEYANEVLKAMSSGVSDEVCREMKQSSRTFKADNVVVEVERRPTGWIRKENQQHLLVPSERIVTHCYTLYIEQGAVEDLNAEFPPMAQVAEFDHESFEVVSLT